MYTLRNFSDTRFLQLVDRAGRLWRGPLAAAFVAAVERLRRDLSIEEPDDMLTSSAWDRFEENLLAAYLVTSAAGRVLAAATYERAMRSTLRLYDFSGVANFTVRASAEDWLGFKARDWAIGVRNSTRNGLKRGISITLAEPAELDYLGRQVRDFVGLTANQTSRFAQQVIQASQEGVLPLRGGAERAYSVALRRRAQGIADHEAREAANAGTQGAYIVAKKKGYVEVSYERGFFVSRAGDVWRYPPRHPRCRCVTRMTKKGLEWVTQLAGVCPICVPYDGVLWQSGEPGDEVLKLGGGLGI